MKKPLVVPALAEGVAGTAERFVQLMNEQAKALGMDVEMISPAEALRLYPHMSDKDVDDVIAAVEKIINFI